MGETDKQAQAAALREKRTLLDASRDSTRQAVFRLVREDPPLTARVIAERVGLSESAVKRMLRDAKGGGRP